MSRMMITDPEIDTSVYQSNVAIGGPEGNRFALEDKVVQPLLVRMIVHRDDNDIRGMRIELNNGDSKDVGRLIDSQPVILDFTGTQMTNIVIHWGSSKWGSAIVKGININTIKGVKKACCRNFDQQTTQSNTLPVGSGYCAGVFGRVGEAIDALGMAMLKVPPRM